VNDVKEILSKQIKKRLKELNMKQKDLIEKTGQPKSTISKVINGVVTPRIDVIIPISKVLNVSIDWLVHEQKDTLDCIDQEIITLLKKLDENQKIHVYRIIKDIISLVEHNETTSIKK